MPRGVSSVAIVVGKTLAIAMAMVMVMMIMMISHRRMISLLCLYL